MSSPGPSGSASMDHPFELADPNFDPTDNAHIKKFYADRRKKGVLPKDEGLDDSSIDEIIQQKIKDIERIRGMELEEEEKKKIARQTRRMNGDAWLRDLRYNVVGKDHVPIAYFNKAQYQATIPYVLKAQADAEKMARDKDDKIKEVEAQLAASQEANSTANEAHAAELEKYKSELADSHEREKKLQARIDELVKNVWELADAHEREKKLQAKIDELVQNAWELTNSHEGEKMLQAKIDELVQNAWELTNSHEGEKMLQARIDELEKLLKDLEAKHSSTLKDLENCRETGAKRYEELQNLKERFERSRANENRLKDDARKASSDVEDLKSQLAAAKTNAAQVTAGSDDDDKAKRIKELEEDNKMKDGQVDALRRVNNDLLAKIETLEKQIADLNGSAASSATDDPQDNDCKKYRNTIKALQQELADLRRHYDAADPARASHAETLRALEAQRQATRKAQLQFLNRLEEDRKGNNLTVYWEIVEATHGEMAALQRRVLELWMTLGFAEDLPADGMLAKLLEVAREAPPRTPAPPRERDLDVMTRSHFLRLRGQLASAQTAELRARLERDTLRDELADSRAGRTYRREDLARRGFFDDREMEARVHARTRWVLAYVKQVLDVLWAADADLAALAKRHAASPCVADIRVIRHRYFSIENMPVPPGLPAAVKPLPPK
ncbi:hypothetical protein F4778DRAFT_165251 [Xylariomycetidae sp. FL2044]|nr:hypothetical protein F4778DRAFT_165251 [Xylariomycetidae sp. FL2044]